MPSWTIPGGVKRIGAGQVHPTEEGQGISVAVLDSGIDYRHSDLDANYGGGYDFVNRDADPLDDYGHGTLVAGVIAAEDNGAGVVGVAPLADLYAVKVLDSRGSGYVIDVIAGLDWAVGHGVNVVNMSFGTSDHIRIFENAIANAYDAGLVLVAAAGNSGTCSGGDDSIAYPARFPQVIAVGATDQSDVRPCWSSTGPALTLAAPGAQIMTTYLDGGYAYAWGTSLTSPHVAGVAALVLGSGMADASGDGRVNDEVQRLLEGTAQDLGTPGWDSWYDFGLVDVAKALLFDSDVDEFTNAAESYMGTDPFGSCPDDPSHAAWPPDFDNTTWVNILDIVSMFPHLFSYYGWEYYDSRYDLNTDLSIDILDLLKVTPHLFTGCSGS